MDIQKRIIELRGKIEKHNINRDSMNLIDENLKNNLHKSYTIKEMAGGGSLGNSMFGIASFGGNGSFTVSYTHLTLPTKA